MGETESMPPRTLFEKVWQAHVVAAPEGQSALLYIDLHLVHEVTSPQAFDGLRANGRRLRQPLRTVATVDHNIPTTPRGLPITDPIAAKQIEALQKNCREFGVPFFDMDSPEQGIVHVIGPELGITLPGMTIVCGDSHTSTHGAFGSLAFGIGTSDDFVFDNQMLAQCVFFGFHIGEVSCPTKYFAEASSINFRRSVQYGLGVLLTSVQFRLQKIGLAQFRIFNRKGRCLEPGPDARYYSPKATERTITDGRSGG